MANLAETLRLTGADFVAWESDQADRHEFFDGEVSAMAGGEDRHTTVIGNLYHALRLALSGSPCRLYMQDVKVRVAADDNVFYPDVFVTCSAADAQSRLVKSEPRFIAEVLSPSTARFDAGAKFASYRRLPTLEEYLLVDLEARRADLFRKGADGRYVLHPSEPGEAVRIGCFDCEITAEALFGNLEA